MAGPVLEILLRHALSVERAFALVRDAASSLGLRAAPAHAVWASSDERRLFAEVGEAPHDLAFLLVATWDDLDDAEIEERARLCGYAPVASIVVMSMTRDRGIARRQAELTVAIAAEAGDVFIDLDGCLCPPGGRSSDPDHLRDVRRHVAGRPGAIVEWLYETGDGRQAVGHLVDRAFLAAWLRDPEFDLPN